MGSFRKCSQKAMLDTSKFKENSRQWKVTYDPYKSNKIL